MKQLNATVLSLLIALVTISAPARQLAAKEWSIPVAGNAYCASSEAGEIEFSPEGGITWQKTEEVYSVYFYVNRAATLDLALVAAVAQGSSTILVRTAGQEHRLSIKGTTFERHQVGAIKVPEPGYVRVDLQGVPGDGDAYAEVRDLVIKTDPEDVVLNFVNTNEGNMFYWGRRGPSVHLSYQVPKEVELQFAYTELTVPEGQDILGTYAMANGFAEGYFGMQVNSPTERRVLFSVWSPFNTDNPREVPTDQRVVALASGPDVRLGEFGNEGSGGQSFLVYPWTAGKTYCFLTEVQPDGKSNTRYTAWFREQTTSTWQLIASFRRPNTDTHLKGFHSFLENFIPAQGHVERRAQYGNVWVRDTHQGWHECTQARFSVDATGDGKHRLDFTGGNEGNAFFLRHCGFFNHTGKPGDLFTREATREPPSIDFGSLPRD